MIEGGPSREYKPATYIEGERVESFQETTIDRSDPMELEDVTWDDYGALIHFRQVGRYSMRAQFGQTLTYPLYESVIVYKTDTGRKKTNLTKVTKQKRCLFTGSRNGFFMHDPAWDGVESNFYVIGLQPREMQNICENAGTFHELGHAIIVDNNYDTDLFNASLYEDELIIPPVKQAITYASSLHANISDRYREDTIKYLDGKKATSQAMFEAMQAHYGIDNDMRLFHERNAWAAGMRLQKRLAFPTGFTKRTSLITYAKFCLESYARSFGDRRFVEGLR